MSQRHSLAFTAYRNPGHEMYIERRQDIEIFNDEELETKFHKNVKVGKQYRT